MLKLKDHIKPQEIRAIDMDAPEELILADDAKDNDENKTKGSDNPTEHKTQESEPQVDSSVTDIAHGMFCLLETARVLGIRPSILGKAINRLMGDDGFCYVGYDIADN